MGLLLCWGPVVSTQMSTGHRGRLGKARDRQPRGQEGPEQFTGEKARASKPPSCSHFRTDIPLHSCLEDNEGERTGPSIRDLAKGKVRGSKNHPMAVGRASGSPSVTLYK